MTLLRTALIGTSRKENERRVAVHPRHLDRIPEKLRRSLFLEHGYGEAFGISDEWLAARCGGLGERAELLSTSPLVVLPKPLPEDLEEMSEGGILWGWPHCVQQEPITQVAIDRRQTLIAFEAMHAWSRDGRQGVHVLAKNNELAGYCAILHALALSGADGAYGPAKKVSILGFGSVSRGAAYALLGRGFTDLTFYTQRPPHLVADQIPGCRHRRMLRAGDRTEAVELDGSRRPLVEALSRSDVIVNGTLQDPERPLMYLAEGEEHRLPSGCLVVDVSCDRGMGFPFARPTSFRDPVFRVGEALYYAVDHTPTYLWDAASWEISEALLPYLATVLGGPDRWAEDPTISRAIEIREGVVENETILSFQDREAEYPHRKRV